MQGCPSWKWYFPYHYAPFASDFVDITDADVKFEKGTGPVRYIASVLCDFLFIHVLIPSFFLSFINFHSSTIFSRKSGPGALVKVSLREGALIRGQGRPYKTQKVK